MLSPPAVNVVPASPALAIAKATSASTAVGSTTPQPGLNGAPTSEALAPTGKKPSFDDALRRALTSANSSAQSGSSNASPRAPKAPASSDAPSDLPGLGLGSGASAGTDPALNIGVTDNQLPSQSVERLRDRFDLTRTGVGIPAPNILAQIQARSVTIATGTAKRLPTGALVQDGLVANQGTANPSSLEPLKLGLDIAPKTLIATGHLPSLAFTDPNEAIVAQILDTSAALPLRFLAGPSQDANSEPASAESPAGANRSGPRELAEGLADRAAASSVKNAETASRKEQDGSGKLEQTSTRPALEAVSNTVLASRDATGYRATNSATNAKPAVQIADAIVVHSEWIAREGRTEFRLHLEPPELGSVRVHLTATDQGVNARILVHDHAARQMIQSHLDSLRQRLRDQGISLGRLDVSGGDAGNPGQRQTAEPISTIGNVGTSLRRPTTASTKTSVSAASALDVVVY